MATAPSYLIRNRFGVYVFQIRRPLHVLQADSTLKPVIRRSTGTRARRDALQVARRWSLSLNDQWSGIQPVMDDIFDKPKSSDTLICFDLSNFCTNFFQCLRFCF